MTERLVYPSRRRLRSMQLGAGAVAAALVVGGVLLEFSRSQWAVAVLLVLSAAWTIVALEWRVRRPLPELRLSTAGIEGAFGLIEWQDVTGVDAKTRLRLHARGVIVRLRPGAHLLLPTREFAEVGDESRRSSATGSSSRLATSSSERGSCPVRSSASACRRDLRVRSRGRPQTANA
jgi:hypothetical protein